MTHDRIRRGLWVRLRGCRRRTLTRCRLAIRVSSRVGRTPGKAVGSHEPLPKKSVEHLRKMADVGANPGEAAGPDVGANPGEYND